MILDDYETLLTSNDVKLHNDLCNHFDSYCFNAIMLREKRLHVEFRRALFKVFNFVEQILQVEHSRTLVCFLEIFIYFIQTELSEVTFILRNFISEMFAKVTRERDS